MVGYNSAAYTVSFILSTGAIIGIVMGVIVFGLSIGLCIWYRRRRMAAMTALNIPSNTSINATTVVIPNNGMAQPMYPYPQAPYGQAYPQQQYGIQYAEP